MVLLILLVAQAMASPASAPEPQKQPLVCRQSQQETGSRIRKGKRCKTEEEWAKIDEERTLLSPSTRITEGQGDSLTRSPPH